VTPVLGGLRSILGSGRRRVRFPDHTPPRLGVLVIGMTAVVGAALPAQAAPAPPGPVEFAPGDRAFYDAPNPIPAGEHGDLVRWQVIESSFTHRYRIMYLSETVAGAPTVVTALVEAPEEIAPFGGWRLLLYGHGSTGLADICSPSMVLDGEFAEGDHAQEFDSIGNATNEGWVVVATDYEGLGGPGSHPMLVGISEGRSMLDAGRAARQIPGLYAGDTTAIAGFSQGGHAALWAAQLAGQWTPEQTIVGTVAGAAASEPAALASWAAPQPQLSALAVGIVAGLATTHPEALAGLGQVLTPSGVELIGQWNTHCFNEQVDVPGPFVSADPAAVEPFASLLAANTAGTVATPAPVLIFHSNADERIPFEHSDALLARLCAAGQVVERRVIEGGPHVAAASAVQRDGVPWLSALAGGTATPISSCPA
jgi:acetyl esterase/lipase